MRRRPRASQALQRVQAEVPEHSEISEHSEGDTCEVKFETQTQSQPDSTADARRPLLMARVKGVSGGALDLTKSGCPRSYHQLGWIMTDAHHHRDHKDEWQRKGKDRKRKFLAGQEFLTSIL